MSAIIRATVQPPALHQTVTPADQAVLVAELLHWPAGDLVSDAAADRLAIGWLRYLGILPMPERRS